MKLQIKVKPNAKADVLLREADGGLCVKIKAAPVDGKANKQLMAFLSQVIDMPRSKFTLLKGETNIHKTIAVEADEKEVWQKIEEYLKKNL